MKKYYQTLNIIERTVLFTNQNTFYNGETKNKTIARKNNKEFVNGTMAYNDYYDFQYQKEELDKKECSCAEEIPDLEEDIKEYILLPEKTYECERSKKIVRFGIPPKEGEIGFLGIQS